MHPTFRSHNFEIEKPLYQFLYFSYITHFPHFFCILKLVAKVYNEIEVFYTRENCVIRKLLCVLLEESENHLKLGFLLYLTWKSLFGNLQASPAMVWFLAPFQKYSLNPLEGFCNLYFRTYGGRIPAPLFFGDPSLVLNHTQSGLEQNK